MHIFICTRLRRTIHYINSIKPRACFPRRAPRRGISAAEGRAEAHDKALNRAGVWRESAGQAGLGLSRARALLSRQTPARGAPPRPFPAAPQRGISPAEGRAALTATTKHVGENWSFWKEQAAWRLAREP